MTCVSCGSPATGGLCRDCELAERFEAGDPETFTDGGETKATNDRRPDGDANAAVLLRDVADLVHGDRDTHGDAVEQQAAAAQAWTWYLQIHGLLSSSQRLRGSDVARMQELLKISRGGVGEYDLDHDRDAAGYAGIAGASAVQEGDADRDDLTRGAGEEDPELRSDGGAVVTDDPAEETLELTDDGIEMPAFLRGYVGTFTLRTAKITGELKTTESGLPDADVADTVFAVYPDDDGDHNPYLRSGLMSFETPEHGETIYKVVDRRADESQGGDPE